MELFLFLFFLFFENAVGGLGWLCSWLRLQLRLRVMVFLWVMGMGMFPQSSVLGPWFLGRRGLERIFAHGPVQHSVFGIRYSVFGTRYLVMRASLLLGTVTVTVTVQRVGECVGVMSGFHVPSPCYRSKSQVTNPGYKGTDYDYEFYSKLKM